VGEAHGCCFQASFNRAVHVRATNDRLTSDAGVLLFREADHRLGLTEALAASMVDPRDPESVRYQFVELLRERLYGMALGYATQDDLDRLAHDPAMKMAVWDRPGDGVLDERLASQPTQSRLLATVAQKANRARLRSSLADACSRHLRATGGDHAARRVTLDIDSFPIEVHGAQAGAAYNGYYHCKMYHPLVASYSVQGDYDSPMNGGRLGNGFMHAVLRRGNCHTAEGMLRFTRVAVTRARSLGYVVDLRIDAGFTTGMIMDGLTDDGIPFLGRLKSNPVLDDLALPHLTRPVGRPPKEGYETVIELGPYQAKPWRHPQRLVLVVIDQPDAKTGQLNFEPDYFFLVTNRSATDLPGDAALASYRPRGTFEDRLGEFNATVRPRLSSPGFAENEATFLMSLCAFNLSSMLRCELEAEVGGCWDLRRFQQQVLKTGGRIVKHSRRLWVDLARVASEAWELLLKRISGWKLPSRWPAPRGPARRVWIAPPPHAHQRAVLIL